MAVTMRAHGILAHATNGDTVVEPTPTVSFRFVADRFFTEVLLKVESGPKLPV